MISLKEKGLQHEIPALPITSKNYKLINNKFHSEHNIQLQQKGQKLWKGCPGCNNACFPVQRMVQAHGFFFGSSLLLSALYPKESQKRKSASVKVRTYIGSYINRKFK